MLNMHQQNLVPGFAPRSALRRYQTRQRLFYCLRPPAPLLFQWWGVQGSRKARRFPLCPVVQTLYVSPPEALHLTVVINLCTQDLSP